MVHYVDGEEWEDCMKYRSLGQTGLQVSEIGFGAWAIGGEWGSKDDDAAVEALASDDAHGAT